MIKEIAKGLAFTLKKMGTHPITVQYPEEQKPAWPRHRGRHILHRYDNGLERCIGCELCAAACPVGCIYVLAAENDPQAPISPGERYAERYEINLMRCIYCGYCAEACPTEAITLGPRFELADYRRERTVVTKAELLESWPGFAQAQGPASPVGAGADQTGREELDPGVNPRAAWASQENLLDHERAPAPGALGVPVDVPTVIEPGARKDDVTVLFAIVIALAAFSSLGVVLSRQTIYSALSLVLTVSMLAVLFLLLNAQFLFAVQLIVYAGAVMVLFVFIVALLSPDAEDRPALDVRAMIGIVGVVGVTVLVFVAARNGITYSTNGFHAVAVGTVSDPYHTFKFPQAAVDTAGNVQTVAGQLFTNYLLPFEITSMLLLVAAIGAVYLTRRSSP